jgi:phospholipase/carboxylesterase
LACYCQSEATFPHAIFAPLHYERGYAYPLIVWLHGHGGNERQLQRVMPVVSMRNYVAVAPRGNRLPDQAGRDAYGWLQTQEHIQQAQQIIFDSVALASRKFNVSSRRIFLTGVDQGGTMALRIALKYPAGFAGAISLGGRFPTGRTPFGNLVEARRLSLFLGTGRVSQEYPAAQVCEDLRLLHAAGLSVTLRQYPCGDELMPQMLSDLDRWIIEQITPSSAPVAMADAQWSLGSDL